MFAAFLRLAPLAYRSICTIPRHSFDTLVIIQNYQSSDEATPTLSHWKRRGVYGEGSY